MSIRLNKALSELNIGLQTAVEFLEKRSELGEVKQELSFKLNDQQYNALVEAFKQDKEVRSQAEKLLQKKPKDKKQAKDQAKEGRTERVLPAGVQQYKPLGKIDLDSLGKKQPSKPAAQTAGKNSKNVTAAVSHDSAKANNGAAQKPAVNNAAKPAEAKPAQQNAQKPAAQHAEAKPAAPKVQETEQKKAQPEVKAAANAAQEAPVAAGDKPADQRTPLEQKHLAQQQKSDDIFTTKSEKKMLNAPKVNVLGKIDLATLNQSTRPKKKSKEEKRKEREEKAQQQRDGKKKRERINKVRVDINAASNQQGGRNNNGGGNSAGGNGGAGNGKKKKNRNRNQKPVEVNDEDVARQVKETLARLTNKQNQTKKGAKYRKEKREAAQEKMNEERREEKKESKTLKLTEFVTVSELATMMNINVNQVIGTLMSVGIMVSINQRLDAETINLVAEEFGFKTEYVSAEVQEAITEEADD